MNAAKLKPDPTAVAAANAWEKLMTERRYFWVEQGALHYVIICLIALAIIYLDLGQRGMALWALFCVAIGLSGLATSWGATPVLLVGSLAIGLSLDINRFAVYSLGSSLLIPDLTLAAAVLAFVMAHNRFTLLNHAFAPTGRPRRKKKPASQPPPPAGLASTSAPLRSRRLVSPREIGRLLLAVPLWALAAEICWVLLPDQIGNPYFQAPYWRLILSIWLMLGALLLAAAILSYIRLRRQTPAEAVLALQDVVWRETRWEQRRINRWFAWQHVRSTTPPGRARTWLGRIVLVLILLGALALIVVAFGPR